MPNNSKSHHQSFLRILVVDDEQRVREILSMCLSSDGHVVETATNGHEGLDKFWAGRFDLVLTDRMMPKMSGDQLASAIKEIAPHTPVIMLTGLGEMMKAAGQCPEGVDMILSKPIMLTELRDALIKVKA